MIDFQLGSMGYPRKSVRNLISGVATLLFLPSSSVSPSLDCFPEKALHQHVSIEEG
jgi:hypothetical protein